MEKKIAIILVNYKDYGERFLTDCYGSLLNQTYTNWQLYIVDNASTEETYEYLKGVCPKAKVLRRVNGNYSAGNNLGIREAIKDGLKYFVVANMDTEFDKYWLEELVKVSRQDKVGLVQSKLLLFSKDGKKRINSLGNKLQFLGFGFTSGYLKDDYDIQEPWEIKGYVSGCSLMISKRVYEKIGGYNEDYYMYHDDIELSLKVKLAGYKLMLAPRSVVYHKYEFSRSVRMIYYMERNRYITMFSFFKTGTLLLILPPLLIMDIGMMFYSILGGWFKSWFKVKIYFLNPSSWLKIIQFREEIRNLRKISDRELCKGIVARIEFSEISNPILRYIVNPILAIYWFVIRKIIIW